MKQFLKVFRSADRNKTFIVGFVIILSICFTAAFADLIAPFAYDEIDVVHALKPPSIQHPLGTDHLGRDSFSRLVYGSRIALKVGVIAVVIQILVGVSLGLIAGFYGGWPDRIIIFFTDVIWSLPPIILAIAICTVLGPSLTNVIIAIAAVSWAQFTRIVRSKTQSLKNMPYAEAARAAGESNVNIIVLYILPNVFPVVIVLATLALPIAIINTTAMGFLGLGAQPPTPDWGVILANSMTYIHNAPLISIFPGLAIIYIVLGFNLLGEGIRDVLDPRLKI